MVLDADDDLPWDPIWAYVLGEEEEKNRGFLRQRKARTNDASLMSYINDVLPVSESREDNRIYERRDKTVKKEPQRDDSKKKGFAWRRNSSNKTIQSESHDSWEWRISTGSSYDEIESSPVAQRDGPPTKARDAPKVRDRKIDTSSKRKENTKSKDTWDWHISTGDSFDDNVPPTPASSPSSSRDVSPVKGRRPGAISPLFRRERRTENDSWDWQSSSSPKKEKRGFARGFRNGKEPEKWDFLSTTSQEKGARKVRFTRSSSSKDDKAWLDTEEVAAQLSKSQNSFFDWVGINPSFEETESSEKAKRESFLIAPRGIRGRGSISSKDKNQRSADNSLSDNGDLFGGLIDTIIGCDSSDEESSFQSSTEDSSAGTNGDDGTSDDDSRSQPTIQSDATQSQTSGIQDQMRNNFQQNDINEVRLSFQPIRNQDIELDHLPIINEETSNDDSPTPLENRPSINNPHDLSVLNSSEQPSTTATKGFSNIRDSIHCNKDPNSKLQPMYRQTRSAFEPPVGAVHSAASAEYDFDLHRHVFVSYDHFGTGELRVISAAPPEPKVNEQNPNDLEEILVKVEASTVSATDCVIRRGDWWGRTKAPLPNTPGVDIMGIVSKLDVNVSRKFGLDVGDRVISLVKWGGNARYIKVNPAQLVVIPSTVDSAEASCLPETYLSAFQILHLGQASRVRYQEDSLDGKIILLRGFAASAMGHAIAQLAGHAGAMNVFAVAKLKHFEYLSSLGISPLSNDAKDWWKTLTGKIDCIISCDENCADVPYKLLKGNGMVVVLKSFNKNDRANSSQTKKGIFCGRKLKLRQGRMLSYDVYDEWESNLERCRCDLQHLVFLLDNKKVEPHVVERISLNKVDEAQTLVASTKLPGFVVCEPWLAAKTNTICL